VSYQEEGQVRLKRLRAKQAIALAMESRWREAIAVNKSIIEDFPNDVDAYNRLGRAYMELGEYARAREAYGRALELDPYNAIAQKNLRRLSLLAKSPISLDDDADTVRPHNFIKETGKAGVVSLYRLAPEEILAGVVAGDRVYLRISNSSLIVESSSGQYLGEVEPKHGQRLAKLIRGGNKYSVAIVSSTEERVTVIIGEVYQHPSQAGQLSFPPRGVGGPQPYVGDRILGRGLGYEEELLEGSGYTIVGGEEGVELLPEEPPEPELDE